MPVTADDIDQVARSIESMCAQARTSGFVAPYAVLLPKPLYNALKRSGRHLPFEIESYPISKTRRHRRSENSQNNALR